jgi:hypothetical protein
MQRTEWCPGVVPLRDKNIPPPATQLILYRQRADHAQSEINVAFCVARGLLSELSELLRRADALAQHRYERSA